MKDHWYEATYLLETLVMKAAGQDVNGADLLFTSGSVILNNEKDASKFRRAMKNPEALPRDNIHTHLRKPLGKIFANYLRGLEEGRKNAKSKVVKNLTLIILTDGIWAAIQNKDDVKRKIVSLVEAIREVTDNLQERPISIDFVQFGNDEGATYRLQCLDNDLKWEGIPDIIDTEPSYGDVNKMLLGSFVEEYDEDDNGIAPRSPISLAAPPGLRTTGSPASPNTPRPLVSPNQLRRTSNELLLSPQRSPPVPPTPYENRLRGSRYGEQYPTLKV